MTILDLVTGLFLLLTYGLLGAGLVFWFRTLTGARRGGSFLPVRFRFRRVHVPALAVIMTLTMLLIAAGNLAMDNRRETPPSLEEIRFAVFGSLVEGAVVIAILLATLVLAARQHTDLYRLGFRGDHLWGQLREGALGFIAAFVPVYGMLLVTSGMRNTDTEHPFLRLLKETDFGPTMSAIVVTAAIIAPLKEELMFRVILQSWLEGFSPAWVAVMISSLTFAAVHGLPDALALFPLALILGILFQRRRSYLAVVTVHALFNSYNLAATLISREAAP